MNRMRNLWSKIREHPYEMLVLVLYLVFLCYFPVGITNALDYKHHSFVLSQKAQYAFNYMKYGFMGTRLGQMQPTNSILDSSRIESSYYVHHPVLISVLVGLCFKLFGAYEWSARLTALPLNTMLIACMYLFVKTYWGKRTAFFSVFFLVFSPMMFALKNFVSWESSTLPFIMLTLYMYVSFLKSKVKLRYLLLSFFIGTLSDWQVYFIIPPIIIHYVLFERVRRGWRPLILIPVALLGFGMFLAHVWLLTGSPSGSSQSEYKNTLLSRLNLDSDYNIRDTMVFRRVQWRLARWGRHYYTPLMFYCPLMLAIGMIIKVLASGKLDSIGADSLLLLIYLSYMAYLLIFSALTFFHDFYILSLLSSLPVIASICIRYFSQLIHYLDEKILCRTFMGELRIFKQKPVTILHTVSLTVILACFIIQALPSYAIIYEEYGMGETDPLFTFLSKAPGEPLIVNFRQNIWRPEIRFYMDRVPVQSVTRLRFLKGILQQTDGIQYRYLLIMEHIVRDKYVLDDLKENYWHDTMRIGWWGNRNVTVFDLENKTTT